MYMYIYIYMYTYVYTHTFLYKCIYAYIYTYTYTHTSMYIYAFAHTYMYTTSNPKFRVKRRSPNTGRRRPIGCLKLQVIFRKGATDYRALLRKMTYKDKASYDFEAPCTSELLSPANFGTKPAETVVTSVQD